MVKTFLAIIGVAVLLGAGAFVGRATSKIPTIQLPSIPTPAPTATPTIRSGAAVIKQIQRLNRLEATSYTIESVITAERKGGLLGIGSEKVLLIVHGSVVAGVDLNKLKVSDISVSADGKAVSVNLPAVEILNNSLDEGKTKVYSYEKGWFTGHDPNLETLARQQGAAKILASACEDGIIKRAAQDAKESMQNLLSVLDFDRVEITIEDTPASTCAVTPSVTPAS